MMEVTTKASMQEALNVIDPKPRPISETPDKAPLRSKVRSLLTANLTHERLRYFDEAEEYDLELFRALGEAGLIQLDGELHGPGPSHAAQSIVLEELGAGPTSIGVSLVVQYMGLELLHTYGSAEQRGQFLAPLRTGDARVSFGLSEPDGGTDIARVMSTTAVRLSDGSYSISGAKKMDWRGRGLRLLHPLGPHQSRHRFGRGRNHDVPHTPVKPRHPHRGNRHHGHPGAGPVRRDSR